jgi:REP element-mobilizing transposase RayT
LCGDDRYSGQNFDHRKQWLVERLAAQASAFAIDICAYAVMSSHYHLVLAVDRQRSVAWSDNEVIERWTRLFKGPLLIQQYQSGKPLNAAQKSTVHDIVRVWRERLASISWFMRCLNEFIARQANAEDNCHGRFWEGRFKSIALLDEAAVLSCMAYVDLNPVRAGMADTLRASDFTSIQARLKEAVSPDKHTAAPGHYPRLRPFREGEHLSRQSNLLPCSLRGYIEIVEWTGRHFRDDKRGALDQRLPSAISGFGFTPAQWLDLSLKLQSRAACAIGSLARMRQYGDTLGKRWLSGQRAMASTYGPG